MCCICHIGTDRSLSAWIAMAVPGSQQQDEQIPGMELTSDRVRIMQEAVRDRGHQRGRWGFHSSCAETHRSW